MHLFSFATLYKGSFTRAVTVSHDAAAADLSVAVVAISTLLAVTYTEVSVTLTQNMHHLNCLPFAQAAEACLLIARCI